MIRQAQAKAQIKLTQQSIKIAADLLIMMKKQHALGEIDADPVVAQATLLTQIQYTLPPLQYQLAQQEHLIASLAGHFASEKPTPQFTLEELILPVNLPVSLPSTLVRQRPDIRAAEEALHAASARIGVAIANRLPNIVLSATIGLAPVDFSPQSIPSFLNLLPTRAPGFWDIGANVLGIVFNGGALLHQQRAAIHAYELAMAQYKRVVLDAFQQVADTLKAIQLDADALKIATQQQYQARQSLMIARQKWKLGAAGYLEVLHAQQAHQLALMNLAQSQANRLADTAALFLALGGGWM